MSQFSFSSQSTSAGNRSIAVDIESRSTNHDIEQIRQGVTSTLQIISKTATELLEYCKDFEDDSLMFHCDTLKTQFRKVLDIDRTLAKEADRYRQHNDKLRDIARAIDARYEGDAADDDAQIPETLLDELQPELDTSQEENESQEAEDEDRRYTEFLDIFRDSAFDSQMDSEAEEICEEEEILNIPIDPYTKKEVENPVKNKICGHIYDMNGIKEYIATARRPRCPTIGCSNRALLALGDVEDDRDTRIRIEQIRLRRQQEA